MLRGLDDFRVRVQENGVTGLAKNRDTRVIGTGTAGSVCLSGPMTEHGMAFTSAAVAPLRPRVESDGRRFPILAIVDDFA